jgi:hypothetical protein
MRKYRTNADSYTVLADILAGTPESFQGSNMHGEPSNGHVVFGRLVTEYHPSVCTATYVVYSYGTPIAWRLRDDGWHVPAERYSVTTSKQQGRVRAALSYNGADLRV